MNDIRFRTCCALILSLAAFFSLAGALAALVWWVVFSSRFHSLPRISVIAGTLTMVGVVAAVLQLMNGTGIPYAIRMGAILIIGIWVYAEHQPGEFLDFGIWLFGKRAGFDLGLTAELAMQAFDGLLGDLERLKTAWMLKGLRLDFTRLGSAGIILVRGALVRAHDTADLLAVRGYRTGGNLCPVFRPVPSDLAGGAAALVAGLIAIIPFGDVFILPW